MVDRSAAGARARARFSRESARRRGSGSWLCNSSAPLVSVSCSTRSTSIVFSATCSSALEARPAPCSSASFSFERLQLLAQHEDLSAAPGHFLVEELVFVLFVLPRFLSLALERAQVALDFLDDVVQARKIGLGRFHLAERFFLPRLVLGDAGGFFDQQAPLFGLGVDDLADLSLLDDRVAFGADAGIHEKLLNVFEPRWHAIDEIFAFAAR